MRTPLALLWSQTLLLLVLTAAGQQTWEEERLSWLVVTRENAPNVSLNCTSNYIHPFNLLNDSSVIGGLGKPVRRIWWVLPDGRQINESSSTDERIQVVDRGIRLLFPRVIDGVHGLYHCAVEACMLVNGTLPDVPNCNTSVFFYKRALNLYGADIYGGNAWEKYKRNTLIGSLTAGAFLALIAAYALLDHFGVFSRIVPAFSNTVDILDANSQSEAAVVAEGAPPAPEEKDATMMSQTELSSPLDRSRDSLRSRSRRMDKAADAADATQTAEAADTAETVA